MNILGYEGVVEPLKDELGGGFVGYVAALPGCVSDGETYQEAAASLSQAVNSWLEAALAFGVPIPQRQYTRIPA